MQSDITSALAWLAQQLALPEAPASVRFTGQAPDLPGPHRLSQAAALALAAHGMAAATLWQQRGGAAQGVEVDMGNAHHSLSTGLFQSIDGHSVSIAHGAASPVSNFFETADGRWIHPMGTYPALRDGVLRLLDCANHTDAIADAVRNWRAFELEDALAARGLAGAVVRSREEWLDHPQGQLLARTPLVRIDKIAEGPVPAQETVSRPLQNLRVIDFTHVIAGPVLSRTLAEHGAQVLHVGSARHPDPFEFVLDTGWGKRSAYLDLGRADNLRALDGLLASTDVFVQSWRPGLMEEHGLGARALGQRHPGMVCASISAYGDSGPWATRKGFEQLAQAVTGVAAAEGGDDRPRMVPTVLLNDYLAAYLGAAGVMAALVRRAREGGSYHVQVSLAGCSMWVQGLGTRVPGADAVMPDASPLLAERGTPFGLLRHLPPLCRLERTPGHWELPPSPPGAHPLAWQ